LVAGLFPEGPVRDRARIAVARDAAFTFYYEDNLDLLAAWGAEIVPFSPLADEALPDGCQGIYVGGGFPEIYAEALAANEPLHTALRRAAARGVPIYGECGGLMYLGRGLIDFDGRGHRMSGVLPVESIMQRRRVTLGYRTATALRSTPLLPAGVQVMGHEFHYSELATPIGDDTAAYRLAERDDAPEGYAAGNVVASYVHLHFGGRPESVLRFIDACRRQDPLARSRA
jgi:cobyrinic acid a,c-diamide synthase